MTKNTPEKRAKAPRKNTSSPEKLPVFTRSDSVAYKMAAIRTERQRVIETQKAKVILKKGAYLRPVDLMLLRRLYFSSCLVNEHSLWVSIEPLGYSACPANLDTSIYEMKGEKEESLIQLETNANVSVSLSRIRKALKGFYSLEVNRSGRKIVEARLVRKLRSKRVVAI